MRYSLSWDRGPSAVIDVRKQDEALVLRYDGPFRLTLRPLLEAPGTADDLQEPVTKLRDIAGRAGVATGRGHSAAGLTGDQLLGALADNGDWLCRTLLPRFVAGELANQQIFLEVGTDEALLPVPFELMRDDSDFICLRHAMGRYVNLGTGLATIKTHNADGNLAVLLICVPKPQPAGGTSYDNLPEAEAEYRAVVDFLVDRGVDVVPLYGPDATKREVMKALKGTTKFTIVHFTGHGHNEDDRPGRSGLVLFDGVLTIGEIAGHLDNAPALAFINGCETAAGRAAGSAGEQALPMAHLTRVFGTARPFLDQGSYVLGTRWRVSDTASAQFATTFYSNLLGDEPVPIGEAVRRARTEIYDPESEDLSWASYVYYGDPRLVVNIEQAWHDPTGNNEALPAAVPSPPDPALPAHLVELADEYERIRVAEASSWDRTRRLSALVQPIRTAAVVLDATQVRAALESDDEGTRLVGVVAARDLRSSETSGALVDLLARPRSSFEEYHVLTSLLDVVDNLDSERLRQVQVTLQSKLESEEFLTSDRAALGRELLRKIGGDYLERAVAVARAVCRIRIGRGGAATGVLVGPRLLLTNNHVLQSPDQALGAEAQFDYQDTVSGELLPIQSYYFEPDTFFVTDPVLDFTIVALAAASSKGHPLERYPWLRLNPTSGGGGPGDPISIIQHPRGGLKQVVLRNNEVIVIPNGKPDFVYYTTDIEPVSSGSPCFNDQWEMIALHHSGVPRMEGGAILKKDGTPWSEPADDLGSLDWALIDWIANEATRVSAIVESLKKMPMDGAARNVLEAMLTGTPPDPVILARS